MLICATVKRCQQLSQICNIFVTFTTRKNIFVFLPHILPLQMQPNEQVRHFDFRFASLHKICLCSKEEENDSNIFPPLYAEQEFK